MTPHQKVLALINPAARSGRLAALEGSIRQYLESVFSSVRVVLTTKKGHAHDMAYTDHAAFDLIIAIGGDGTVHEVGTGLVRAQSTTPMGVVPMGSGNDYARAIGMSEDWKAAIDQIAKGELRHSDSGDVTWNEDGEAHTGQFLNALGVGFDAHCAVLAPAYKGWPLGIGYTVAILAGLRSWVSAGATIWNLTDGKEPMFSGRMMFTTIGNAQDSGGGYSINPKAQIADGLLDACMVENVSFLRALMLLPSTRDGKHLAMNEVKYEQVEQLLIETDRGLPIHADGEVLSHAARSIQVSVARASLAIMVPQGSPEKL